jgi:hypothetical protein
MRCDGTWERVGGLIIPLGVAVGGDEGGARVSAEARIVDLEDHLPAGLVERKRATADEVRVEPRRQAALVLLLARHRLGLVEECVAEGVRCRGCGERGGARRAEHVRDRGACACCMLYVVCCGKWGAQPTACNRAGGRAQTSAQQRGRWSGGGGGWRGRGRWSAQRRLERAGDGAAGQRGEGSMERWGCGAVAAAGRWRTVARVVLAKGTGH